MIKNYFKIAWRNLTKHKAFSFINITGLAVGLATTMLILLWVKEEVSVNRFHANYDRIYSVMEKQANGAEVATFPSIPMPAAATIKQDIPEVQQATRISWGETRLLTVQDKAFVEPGLYVDPDFLTIFSFPLLQGSAKTSLNEPNTVVLSEKLATRYFGNEDPVGKIIRVSQKLDYKVVGVLKDVPANSTLKFDWLMPMSDYIRDNQMNGDSWGNNNIRTAVLLKPGAEPGKVNDKIKNLIGQHNSESKNITLFLHAASDWYLRNDFKNGEYTGGGRITYVRLFSIVAIFVLLIACINFMNLSTARATQRAKEVGVRKVAGADKQALVWQFLGESLLLTAFAGVLAVVVVSTVLPLFNDLLSKKIQIDWQNGTYITTYLGILLVTSLLAGLYPAFVLSGYQPVRVLKGGRTQLGGGAVRIRQSLVVMQFTLSILLIIGTMVVYQQVSFIRNKNLGYNKDNVLWFSTEDLNDKRYELAHSEFGKVPGVESVTVANTAFNGPTNRENGLRWPGKADDDKTLFAVINGDRDMLPTMGLQLKDGRNFSSTFGTDSTSIIINEEAARRMNLKDPVGTPVEFGENWKGTIIGVVKDFHLSSIHSPIEPTVITYQPQYTWVTFVRLDGQNVPAALSKLEEKYKSLLPGYPFEYHFLDQEFDKIYKSEMQIGQLANWFSGLAIFISCLGLFGLASFTVERRTKEIGVRKVLGASIFSVFTLISREFIALVLIALLLAAYPAWYLMNDWLSRFAYQVEISWWVFAGAGLLSVGVALLTVSFQSVKASVNESGEVFTYGIEGGGRYKSRKVPKGDYSQRRPPFILSSFHTFFPLKEIAMIKNYLKIALRNLVKNKVYSFINIFGLAVGMAVAMLIGLWIWDELSFNKHHQHYDRIAQLMQNQTFNGEIQTWGSLPIPVGEELRKSYGDYFERVVLASRNSDHSLAVGDQKFTKKGKYMEPEGPELLSLDMLKGTRAGLTDPNSILLSESLAKTLFGEANPMGKILKIDNKLDVKVSGVYQDLPYNTTFREVSFIAPWDLYVGSEGWVKFAQEEPQWNNNSWPILVQLAPNVDFGQASAIIKDVKLKKLSPEEAKAKPEVFLFPMSRWHLYSEFNNGINDGGRIRYVWLFGGVGVFVLLLACINFMNLSTARSEKRAKEVGVRKAIGSLRGQLITQFFSESLMVVAFAFGVSLVLVFLILPFFNEVADKKLTMLWTNPVFWGIGLGFSLITGLLAGSYPALYLSSFRPVKVLKGTVRVGRLAALPRKALVVVQFTVSVALLIGTILVFRQIDYAKSRPTGYNRTGLITVPISTEELRNNLNAVQNELVGTGAVENVATSLGSITEVYQANGGFEWEGKDPNFKDMFGTIGVSYDFGKTVGWEFLQGRDFSRQYSTDSLGMVLNESAVRYMGLQNPVGKSIKWGGTGKTLQVVGVIRDVVMSNPFEPVMPTIFMLGHDTRTTITLRLNRERSTSESIAEVQSIFKKFNPSVPFEYKFVDEEYATKFGQEERIGKLASFFAVLAIFISCLGLFGLASFVAEQRTKEIGVRKVLGASVLSLWQLLSKDFLLLVLIGFVIASPIAYYFINNWLQNYTYRTDIPWWVFAVAGAGAMLVTLLTVSFHGIKAALMNPVKSLRTE